MALDECQDDAKWIFCEWMWDRGDAKKKKVENRGTMQLLGQLSRHSYMYLKAAVINMCMY